MQGAPVIISYISSIADANDLKAGDAKASSRMS
jgi:hypothetical protein